MNHVAFPLADGPLDQAAVPGALNRADARLTTCADTLARLVTLGPSRMLDEETVIRTRALVLDLATQLAGPDGSVAIVRDLLAENRTILLFCHAMAVEWRLNAALAARRGLDSVTPPLVRRLLDEGSAAAAALVAAELRLGEALRRMRLPLDCLPGDLAHLGWSIAQAARLEAGLGETARPAQAPLLDRTVLMRQVAAEAGDGCPPVEAAGAPLLATIMAQRVGMAREQVVLAMVEDCPLRLALMLRAAGFDAGEAGAQLLALRPGADPRLALLADDADAARDALSESAAE